MKKDQWKKEEIAEDYCFTCKDGGHLRVCDFKECLKAYHPNCVGKDDLFLEDDDRWTCGLHTCNCGKSSSFQCFCCPNSYCHSCIRSAEFVQVKKNKGFCINCLRLAKMIEEDRHVDSDGEEVDFCNTETYEFLFKDYWEIVKDQQGLTLVDVQAADALLKRGENFQNESDPDKLSEEESISGSDDLEDYCDDGKSFFKGLRGKKSRKKTQTKRLKKEKAFIGWASEELVTFLASIGKNTTEALSQVDVTEIIKEYVQSKNLFQPNKKRRNHVVPDDKLHTLFRKKKLKYHKIFDLVKCHLAEEQSDSSDEFSLSSEEDEGIILAKKRRTTNLDYKIPMSETNHCSKNVLEPSGSCYAAIVADNIKLTYLKRSLMLELLKNPETFEDKVVGCFVRIKNDPKDFYFLVQKLYQLGQVTGIKKTEPAYKIGETSTNLVLRISSFSKDIKISMLSDDDFEEEECKDLQQLVKKGLFKHPTIAELERKIRSVHEDIVNHWIDREILKLQKQIDRANEKGWRRELNEYIDRRELLRTREERMRLMEEIPEVIPDTGDTDANVDGPSNLHGVNEAGNGAAHLDNAAEGKPRDEAGSCAVFLDNDAEREAEGGHASDVEVPVQEIEGKGAISSQKSDIDEAEGNFFTSCGTAKRRRGDEPMAMASESNADSKEEVSGRMHQGTIGDSFVQRQLNLESEPKSKISENQVLEIKDEGKYPRNPKASDIQVIDLDDEDDDMASVLKENDHSTIGEVDVMANVSKENNHVAIDEDDEMAEVDVMANVSKENNHVTIDEDDEMANVSKETDPTTIDAATPESHKAIWWYIDPSGNKRGPFPLKNLSYWKECGYFEDNFKVWKSGQCEGDAILLTVALGSAVPSAGD